MKTTVIQIYGPPGAGKSVLAAELYVELSKRGESVELVREVAKQWAWDKRKPSVFEQIYITNEQMLLEASLYGKVNYLVTDSPIELGHFYNKYYNGNYSLGDEWQFGVLIGSAGLVEKRVSLYLPFNEGFFTRAGRFSDLNETREISDQIFDYINHKRDLHILPFENTRLQDALKVIYA